MDLVERAELLAQLEGFLEKARVGAGRFALVGGEAGVGKTALARAFVERLPPSARLLWGACDPLSTPRPLAPFLDMPAVATLVERSRGRHELLTAILDELSLQTVMVVEDAHWADEATLDALRYVGRRVESTRSLVLVTYRDDEVGADHPLRMVLGDLATAGGHRRLHVPPLTQAGVATLAAGHALEPERLHRITGGNPFYVTEVLAAPGWTVPVTVADAVLGRVARLSPQARDLLEIVALAPGGLEPTIAEMLILDAARALDECTGRGVLVPSGGFAAFRHELARLAIEDAIPAGTRRALHLRLLEALERIPDADPARLAHHADAAGDSGRVLRYAPAAAREASARGAHREAARQYGRAVSHADRLRERELADLLFLWAEERWAIEGAPLVDLWERIIELRGRSGDILGRAEAMTRLASSVWNTGRTEEAHRIAGDAVEILEPLPPGPELARAVAVYAVQEMLARHGEEALRWGSRAIELAERVDASAALMVALNAVGSAEIVCFEDVGGIEKLERSRRLAREKGDDSAAGRALGNLGSALGEIRRYELAVPYLEEAIAWDEERDLDGPGGYATAWLAKVRFEQGSWAEAERLALAALRRRSASVIIPIAALGVRGRLLLRRGDDEAQELLDEGWELAVRTGDLQRLWPLAAGRAEAAWLSGRGTEIPALVESTYEEASELGLSWAIGELAFWLWRAGSLADTPAGCAEPFALHMAGEWRDAAAAWERIGCPYERAEALAEGDEAALREALAIFSRLGAEPAADRVRAAMRSAGVARIRSRARTSTRAAPGQLTRRQLEVLALVEAGLSNAEIAERLFITEKTVGHHVSAILRKLGAGSRAEAGALARRLGISAPVARTDGSA